MARVESQALRQQTEVFAAARRDAELTIALLHREIQALDRSLSAWYQKRRDVGARACLLFGRRVE